MRFLPYLALASCLACTSTPYPVTAINPPELVPALEYATPALVLRKADGAHVFCSGVWVSPTQILTAEHCVLGAIDESDTPVALPLGFRVEYTTLDESAGVYRNPRKVHGSTCVKVDHVHDLALLETPWTDTPWHEIAAGATIPPAVGEGLHFVGHPSGLSWSYVHGVVSAYREKNFEPVADEGWAGPYMQVSAPVWFGNSGGGAFDEQGALVGIASFVMQTPHTGFYIHLASIRAFIGR